MPDDCNRPMNADRPEAGQQPEATSDWRDRPTPAGNSTQPTVDHTPASSAAGGPSLAAFMEGLQAAAAPESLEPVSLAQAELPTIPGYEVTHEIAHGGMGVVYAARDRTLDREVAVKTLLPHLAYDPRYASQFDRESRLTASLSHPGVPPVHASGTLADRRPFLAMRLIRGRTLADELVAVGCGTQTVRFIGVFEQICQTVGYAHSLGLIHRDLKPGNVMVGAFGEVQVMDWGLAKCVTAAPSPVTVTGDVPRAHAEGETDDATRAGSAKGTPAYMPPEQARGEWERVDARADVFALGGILCFTLTGKAPYAGKTGADVLVRAERGDLRDAFSRLDACGADAELVTLCKRCLDPDPAGRPAEGKAVADAVAAYRTGVEERARRAESERAAAEAEAREQRKRRKVQLALALAIGLLATGGGAVAWWQGKQAEEKRVRQAAFDAKQGAQSEAARKQVAELIDQATAARREYRFPSAEGILNQAGDIAASLAPELTPQVDQAKFDLGFVRELDEIRMKRSTWIAEPGGGGRFDDQGVPEAYERLFAAGGFNLGDPIAVGDRIAASAVRTELVAGLDDWAILLPESRTDLRARVLATAARADPDSGANLFRDPAVWNDERLLNDVALRVDVRRMSAGTVVTLAELLRRKKLRPVPLLRSALAVRPREFLLAFYLGLLSESGEDRVEVSDATFGELVATVSSGSKRRGKLWIAASLEAVGAYRTARALRPDNFAVLTNLGTQLLGTGDSAGALAVLGEAIERYPTRGQAYANLAGARYSLGEHAQAIELLRKGLTHEPTNTDLLFNLGSILLNTDDVEGAIVSYRAAATQNPSLTAAHLNLGNAYRRKNDSASAEVAYRKVIELDPKHALAHRALGEIQAESGLVDQAIAGFRLSIKLDPRDPITQNNLGIALMEKQDYPGAAAAFRAAIALKPDFRDPHSNLGIALRRAGDLDGAIRAYKDAIEIDPGNALIRTNLGLAYLARKDHVAAMMTWREAILHDPKYRDAYVNIAASYFDREQWFESAAVARVAIKLDPRFPTSHAVLGMSLRGLGDLDGARTALTEAARLDPRFKGLLKQLPTHPVAPPPREVGP